MTTDKVEPKGKWIFNNDVTECFEDMLQRSIPQYSVMRGMCFDIATRFRQEKTGIVDLGCSRGEAMSQLIDKYGAHNNFTGVETSPPMLNASRKRFKGLVDCGIVRIEDMDLRREYPPVSASVTLAVLVLQFIPIEHRQRVLQNIYKHTIDGGVLILVEKVLGSTPEAHGLLTNMYHDLKSKNGYTNEDITRKALSLEGVLVPVTAKWNEDMLLSVGFSSIECFWRCINFVGWIAIK